MEIERLGEIFIEAGQQSPLPFATALMRGQSDCFFPRLSLPCLDHEVEPVAVGQSDVAHEDVEAQIIQQAEGVFHVARTRHFMAAVDQQIREYDAAIFVVLDEKDIHTT